MLHWRRGDYERATQFLNSTINLAVKLQDNPFEALCHNAIALVETDDDYRPKTRVVMKRVFVEGF